MADEVKSDEKLETVADFRAKVQLLISASTPHVVDEIIKIQVKQEQDRRVNLLVDGLKRHTNAETNFKKLTPDYVVISDDGKEERGWSAPKKAERDKAEKALNRLTNALNGAISKGDFKTLEDILKSGNEKSDKPDTD